MQGCGQSVVFIKCLGPRAVRSRYIKSPGPNDIRCQQVFSILFHPFPLRPPIGLVANLPNPSLAFSSVTEIISLLPLAEQFGWEFATLRLHIGDLWSFHLFDSPRSNFRGDPEFMGPSRVGNLVGVVALLHVRMDVAAISSGDPQCHHSNNCHGPILKVLHHPWWPPFSWHQNLTTNVQLLGVHSKLQSVEVSNLYLYFSSPCQLQLSANVAPPRHKGRRKKRSQDFERSVHPHLSTHIQAFPTRTNHVTTHATLVSNIMVFNCMSLYLLIVLNCHEQTKGKSIPGLHFPIQRSNV